MARRVAILAGLQEEASGSSRGWGETNPMPLRAPGGPGAPSYGLGRAAKVGSSGSMEARREADMAALRRRKMEARVRLGPGEAQVEGGGEEPNSKQQGRGRPRGNCVLPWRLEGAGRREREREREEERNH